MFNNEHVRGGGQVREAVKHYKRLAGGQERAALAEAKREMRREKRRRIAEQELRALERGLRRPE